MSTFWLRVASRGAMRLKSIGHGAVGMRGTQVLVLSQVLCKAGDRDVSPSRACHSTEGSLAPRSQADLLTAGPCPGPTKAAVASSTGADSGALPGSCSASGTALHQPPRE